MYTLNLENVMCQLYDSKAEKKLKLFGVAYKTLLILSPNYHKAITDLITTLWIYSQAFFYQPFTWYPFCPLTLFPQIFACIAPLLYLESPCTTTLSKIVTYTHTYPSALSTILFTSLYRIFTTQNITYLFNVSHPHQNMRLMRAWVLSSFLHCYISSAWHT